MTCINRWLNPSARKMRLLGYSLGLISENSLERSHKMLRRLAKNHTRKGRIDLISWDALNHMWNRTSPKQRSLRVRKPKKALKLETPDDFEGSWSPIQNLYTILIHRIHLNKGCIYSVCRHLKYNLVNFEIPIHFNSSEIYSGPQNQGLKIDKFAFQMSAYTINASFI